MINEALYICREHGAVAITDKAFQKITGRHLVPDSYYAARIRRQSPFEYHNVLLPTDNPVFTDEILRRFFWETYEIHEKQAIDAHLTAGNNFVDLGACTGFLSAYAETILPDIQTIAVEPNPNLGPIINETKNLNDANMSVVNAAYHPTASSVEFYQHQLAVGGSTHRETATSVDVPATSLVDLFDDNELSSSMVTCDIEGAEVNLLDAEIDVLENRCSLLIIEIHGFAGGSSAAERILENSTLKLVDEYKISNPNSILVYNNPNVIPNKN
jgi:FkbM family methyltransferase